MGSGSFTRSGVNHQAGAKTPMSAIIAAFISHARVAFLGAICFLFAQSSHGWYHFVGRV
jgi:MFS superfamily sulfate permease-like transporter